MSMKKRIRDTETEYGNLRAAAQTPQKFTVTVRTVKGIFADERGSLIFLSVISKDGSDFIQEREISVKQSALFKMRYNHGGVSAIIEMTDVD
jgi:hypothetical protein